MSQQEHKSRPEIDRIRNIGIISHIDAGKTTVSERILFYTGEIHRMGEVHEGAATMDWMEQEQERGITITATSTCCHWQGCWINLIDTPGHIDFTIEVERSLRVLDGAVTIFSAVEGVQPQSESVWRQADRYQVPRICLINKLDRTGADYPAVLEQMRKLLKARPVLMQLPLGVEAGFEGVVDLLSGQLLRFDAADEGLTVIRQEMPGELRAEAAEARERLLECAADFDDAVLADVLDGRPVEIPRIVQALRRGVLECRLFPVFLGAALRNKGIQPLLDAVCAYLPSPREVLPARAHLPFPETAEVLVSCDPSAPFCALAFKVLADEGRKLTYLRIYSGMVRAGDQVFNATRGTSERLARLFRMHAHKRERLEEAWAGDIVAAAGVKDALTGDSLCDPARPLVLEGMNVPEPVVSIAVEPRSVEDRKKLMPSLEKLQWEDPTFRAREDEETGQTILTGMGELHLEVVVDRLGRDFGVEVKTGRPQVVYRESLSRSVEHREVFDRDMEGRPQHGEILFRLTPLECGEGLRLVLPRPEETGLSAEMLESLRKILEQGCCSGVRAGYPLVDLEVRVEQIPFVPGLTTETGLRIAAQRGLVMAARQGEPRLLEPVMALELTTPADYAGKVLGTLQQKRGRVEGMTHRGEMEVIRAKTPLSEMFGFMTELRSATKGRGTYTLEFSHFEQAPAEVLQRMGLT